MTLKQFPTVLVIISTLATAVTAESPLGRKVADFQLHDFRGEEFSLADVSASKLVVLAFLGTECPLAKRYGLRLGQLANQYQPRGVSFIGLDANVQDSVTEIAAFVRDHNIRFPLLKDRKSVV